MTSDHPNELAARLREAKLLVLGDLRLERVLTCAAEAEFTAPLKLHAAQQARRSGGAAGVACAAAALGARVWTAGLVGADVASGELLRALAAAGADPFGVASAPGAATGECLMLTGAPGVAASWSGMEIEIAPAPTMEGPAAQEMLAHIQPVLGQVRALAVVCRESAERVILTQAVSAARNHGVAIIGGQMGSWLPACDIAVAGVGETLETGAHRATVGAPATDVDGWWAWYHLVAGVALATAVGASTEDAQRVGAAMAAAAATGAPVDLAAVTRELAR